MSSFSPTADGFRLIFRRPAIPLAEIAWRWSVTAACCSVSAMFLIEYANTLQVTPVDRLLLGTQQPFFVARALQRIFHGSGVRFTEAGILLAIGMALAWILLASLGRAAVLKAIMQEFSIASAQPFSAARTASLLALNSLRAAVTLAAILAIFGSALFASGIWASTHLSVASATRVWFLLLLPGCITWAVLNWTISTASLFVLVNADPALPAISQTVGWYRDHLGPISASGTWFGLARFGVLITTIGAGFSVLSVAGILGRAATVFLEILIMLGYFACADFLYTGRLAAYLSIIGGGEESSDPLPRPEAPRSFAVDQSELILSDVPLAAT